MRDTAALARSWVEAVNERDLDRMLELADPEIEIVTPRGPQRGPDAIRRWVELQSYGLVPRACA